MTAGDCQAAMRGLPVATLAAILGGLSPLVLAPHADDESLGCGGLLAQAAAAGLQPGIIILTDGTGSHPHSRAFPPARLRAVREDEARAAAGILGVERVEFLRLRDTAAPVAGPAFDDAVAAIERIARAWECGVLLAPWRHDPHCDHEAAHLMAEAAARRTGLRHLAYPVWGWTLPPDTPLAGPVASGFRLDVTGERPRKARAVAAHRSQYAGLVDDDPGGFQLPDDFLQRFTGRFEVFLDQP